MISHQSSVISHHWDARTVQKEPALPPVPESSHTLRADSAVSCTQARGTQTTLLGAGSVGDVVHTMPERQHPCAPTRWSTQGYVAIGFWDGLPDEERLSLDLRPHELRHVTRNRLRGVLTLKATGGGSSRSTHTSSASLVNREAVSSSCAWRRQITAGGHAAWAVPRARAWCRQQP